MLRSIRSVSVAAAAATAALLGSASGALAGPQDFSLYNYSDQEIASVFVVPDYAGKRGLDALGDLVVGPDQFVDIYVEGYGDYCSFNVWVVTTVGEVVEFLGVDLCTIHVIDITSADEEFETRPATDFIFG
jgi:hypothetical protein